MRYVLFRPFCRQRNRLKDFKTRCKIAQLVNYRAGTLIQLPLTQRVMFFFTWHALSIPIALVIPDKNDLKLLNILGSFQSTILFVVLNELFVLHSLEFGGNM